MPSDRSSKSTTDYQQVQTLLDFTINKVSDLYKCTPEKMQFEMIEGNVMARAQLVFTKQHLNYKVVMGTFTEFSLSYYCCIHIYHFDRQTTIKIPAHRSYNPSGLIEYVTYSQFIFTLKIAAAMVKAALSGAAESEISYLKNCIVPLQSYESSKSLVDYMYIQVKTACYRKIMPPSFPEYIFAQVIRGTFHLREDSKEYLESYLSFSKGQITDIKIPIEYFSSVLKNEKRLSWELKGKYSEMESKATTAGRMLKYLPEIVEDIVYIDIGTNYKEMNAEIYKLFNEFDQSVEQFDKCATM